MEDFAAKELLLLSSADERRLRRMISNRESARRSRARKQRHLEDLRCRVGRLRLENRAVAERLAAISGICTSLLQENQRLQSESATLRQRLSEIHRILFLRPVQLLSSSQPAVAFSPPGSGGEQSLPSLMT
ncbi:Ocs element-binding factor 1 [Apostasia shenzhenica]|uniref:Ocs element-binding factor 1 n=1 Tax=Apostasia shenzhenica TaxID=1088818 RepID=A0A2I0AFB3_9ASPA|nr:Ocs element-binding factor 1 [Apostasia shenzhenica]